MAAPGLPDWLAGHASDLYDWHSTIKDGRKCYWRRMGMVEGLFDTDGTDFEGRADLNMNLHVEVRTKLSETEFRNRILKAWAVFRQKHILLSTCGVTVDAIDASLQRPRDRAFSYRPCQTAQALFEEGQQHLVFVGDHYSSVSADDLYAHLINSSRAINGSLAFSGLHVLPYEQSTVQSFKIHFMLIAAHQIVDGLTTFRWMNSFIDILNLTDPKLNQLAAHLTTTSPEDRLPPAQESLYVPVQGSLARQRWFWAITRMLRHKRKLPPPSFSNPLYRSTPFQTAIPFPPKYSKFLDYSRTPPLNNGHIHATLSTTSTNRLRILCRQARISMGSGLFALVSISMMTLYERRQPDIPLSDRLPFIAGFPVNPRPFLTGNPPPDSLMLAFSDGIILPFLSSSLPIEGRIRLLGKIAHRQLRIYQKRKTTTKEEVELGSKSGEQLMPLLYISSADRLEARRKAEDKQGWNIQGAYPAAMPPTMSTCGISSVGDRSGLISSGRYDVSKLEDGVDTAIDFRDLSSTVRARDGEFLVGAIGEKDWMGFSVSYDACAVDAERAEAWKGLIESLLEDGSAKL